MLIEAAVALAVVHSTAGNDYEPEPLSSCTLARPKPEDSLVVLDFSTGSAVSDVAVAGLDKVTTTGAITIVPGKRPIHIVFFSYKPMLLQFRGAVARLSRVVVVSPEGGGVMGIPRSKVSFSIGETCVRHGVTLKPHLGRDPDLQHVDDSELHEGSTDGSTFRNTSAPDPEGSAGQTRLEEAMDRFYPGGVVRVDPKAVVSSKRPVRYSVLPNTAGALQLERSGAIVRASRSEVEEWRAKARSRYGETVKHIRASDAYRVLRPISIPAGLCGALGITFLVPSADYATGDPCNGSDILVVDGQILHWGGHFLPPELNAPQPL